MVVTLGVLQYKCQENLTQTASASRVSFVLFVYLPVPLHIACVSVYTTLLDSHTCCVYYDRRLDPPHITSSPSSWHRAAGDEQEGNDIMAFLIRAWHQRISKAAYSEFMEIYTGCSLVHVAGRDCKDSKFKDISLIVSGCYIRTCLFTLMVT